MVYGNFSTVDHLNQHPNEHYNPPQICCSNCGANFDELNLMQIFMALKPLIGEEFENASNRVMQRLLQNPVLPPNPSSLLHQGEPSVSRSLLLKFKGSVPDGISTWTKIKEEGVSLEVELVDEFGKRVEVGPESCLKIKIDVLDGKFDVENEVGWTEEIYSSHIAEPRDNKGPILKEKIEVVMSKGVANVSHLAFTDNSSTRTHKKFQVGARVVKGVPPGVVVKTAVSEAFRVKERRQESYKKHEKPSLMDDIWRLASIRKDGPVHERALKAGITTVKDLLQRYHTNPKQVQDILAVPKAMLKKTVENAEACKLPDEHYRYYNAASGDNLVLDCAFNIVSITFKDQIKQQYEDLHDFQKEEADELRRSAYENKSELEKIDVHMKQTSIQEFNPPWCVQGQERQQPAHLSEEAVVGALCGSPDAGRLMSNQMHIISPPYVHPFHATPPDQAEAVEEVNRQMTTLRFDSFQYCDYIEALLQDPDSWEFGPNLPQGEEGGNASQVAAHDHVTSKLLAACYVTKAASLFMISIQQDSSAPNKKRKLQ